MFNRQANDNHHDEFDDLRLALYQLAFALGSTLVIVLLTLSLNKRAKQQKEQMEASGDAADIHGVVYQTCKLLGYSLAVFNAFCWETLSTQLGTSYFSRSTWGAGMTRFMYASLVTAFFAATALSSSPQSKYAALTLWLNAVVVSFLLVAGIQKEVSLHHTSRLGRLILRSLQELKGI